MTREQLLLVGRATGSSQSIYETHAARLRDRGLIEDVTALTYDRDPVHELRDELADIESERTYVVPLCLAHTNETLHVLPSALSVIEGETHYCEPIGRNPAITAALLDRARSESDTGDRSLILVGLGNSTSPHHRQVLEYHATRARSQSAHEEVVSCFLVQNPAVECVRYNISAPSAVAVPLFLTPSPATEREIPAKLELDRGGIEYSEPLGKHPQVTTAIEATLASKRAVAETTSGPVTFEDTLLDSQRSVATDGRGISE